jgi:hypothetical protein
MRALPHAVAVAFLVLTTTAAPAYAAESPAGGPALRQARAAWERGSLDTAESLYREALEKGGLAPGEVVEGYVRLGAVRAARGKKDQAIAAFRAASILDASFAVPREAGRKGATYAAQAKKDTRKIGSIQLSIRAPQETPSGKPFTVTAQLDGAHVAIVSSMALVARDGTSGKETTADSKPGESVELEVPADITLPSASIVVRVDALDKHGNRLASAEERVRVPEATPPAVVAKVEPRIGPSTSAAPTSPAEDTSLRKGGGFWSSPWPYLIGGVALAGASTAVYFGTRPTEDVSVGQIGVRTR